ncbi:MAG TPA: bifunctional phosphoserine phosphatase/homoserine phosphotransferase ThrH [Acidobacteria bacterium]|jgi:phosphoserine/homoserine phosphotransferase|nr:bifunctional phosphoserine phosphatase/homoserine phosphotransferase ThrH [Acidobacteriota bacterium]
MDVVCLDLEGVLVPEIWIQFAQATGIDALKKTTRDVADYDELMRFRLDELRRHKLGLREIESVIQTMSPLDGAAEFLDGLRERYQVVILSDTFYEFSRPLMAQLNWPTLFCHHLVVEADGQVSGYTMRQPEPKNSAVAALQSLNFNVIAAGDSYNDTAMLAQADHGFLFRSPANVIEVFPQYRHTDEYDELRQLIDSVSS